jgi:hypothetical protein
MNYFAKHKVSRLTFTTKCKLNAIMCLVHGAPMVQSRSHKRINAGRCSDIGMVFAIMGTQTFSING